MGLKHGSEKNVSNSQRKAVFLGRINVIKCIKLMYEYSVSQGPLKYILTYKMSQDSLTFFWFCQTLLTLILFSESFWRHSYNVCSLILNNEEQDQRYQGLTHRTSRKTQWIQTERDPILSRSAVQQQQLQLQQVSL